MGVKDIILSTPLEIFNTWDRIETIYGGLQGTVVSAANGSVSVSLDLNERIYSFHEYEIIRVPGEATKIPFIDLLKSGYDFGMLIYDIFLEDGTRVEGCYRKSQKFFEVSLPYRQFANWQIDYILLTH